MSPIHDLFLTENDMNKTEIHPFAFVLCVIQRHPHSCPRCGSPYPFAPGVIERHPRRRWSRTACITVVRAALVLVVLGLIAAMLQLLTGGLL